jgi:hypothetical protein
MRKLMLWLGRVPASLRTLSNKALQVTNKILQLLESNLSLEIQALIPGEKDEAIVMAVTIALRQFRDVLEAAKTRRERKHICKEVAATMVAVMDGGKLPLEVYSEQFQKVFEENKLNGVV